MPVSSARQFDYWLKGTKTFRNTSAQTRKTELVSVEFATAVESAALSVAVANSTLYTISSKLANYFLIQVSHP